jgi:hypothetical protein
MCLKQYVTDYKHNLQIMYLQNGTRVQILITSGLLHEKFIDLYSTTNYGTLTAVA